jgi:hypothetical protein
VRKRSPQLVTIDNRCEVRKETQRDKAQCGERLEGVGERGRKRQRQREREREKGQGDMGGTGRGGEKERENEPGTRKLGFGRQVCRVKLTHPLLGRRRTLGPH